MNAIVYYSKPLKKVNGTLFYSFEYFVFLKQYLPDLKFILMCADQADLEFFKTIFKDKYKFNHGLLNDFILMTPIQFMSANVKHIVIFDVHSYKHVQDYLGRTKTVFLYCNKPEGKPFLNQNQRDTFYGWHENYQFFNIKTRLKLYKEIHRTYPTKGNKIFISSPNGDNIAVAKRLNIQLEDVYIKEPNKHHTSLFENINKIIYWHYGNNDANNRIIVEANIHNIPIDVYTNGFNEDSIYDRKTLIENGRQEEFFLDEDDVLIKDFIGVCGE